MEEWIHVTQHLKMTLLLLYLGNRGTSCILSQIDIQKVFLDWQIGDDIWGVTNSKNRDISNSCIFIFCDYPDIDIFKFEDMLNYLHTIMQSIPLTYGILSTTKIYRTSHFVLAGIPICITLKYIFRYITIYVYGCMYIRNVSV